MPSPAHDKILGTATRRGFRRRRALMAGAGAALLGLLACSSNDPMGESARPGRRFAVPIGQMLTLRVGGLPSLSYEPTPQISTDAVRFLRRELLRTMSPGGTSHVYRFQAVATGTTTITFVTTNAYTPSIIDTVDVY